MVEFLFFTLVLFGIILLLGLTLCAAFGLWIMLLMIGPVIEATREVAEAARRDASGG